MPYAFTRAAQYGAVASADVNNLQIAAETISGGVWNVKEAAYNAKGDGVTDDAAAIQAAITACQNAGGGTVYFPKGTYLIGTRLLISATAVNLIGAGRDLVTLKAKTGLNADLIALNGGIAYTFRCADLTLDHNGANQTAGCAFNASGAVQSVFDNLHITHPYDAGLWLYQIGTGNLGHHNRVTRCLFDNGSVSAGNGQGIRIQSSDENYVAFNDFESNGGAGSEPYHVKDWSGTNVAIGNVFVNGQEGYRMQDSSHSILLGNVFDGLGRDSVHVSGGALAIFSNLFSGGGQTSAGAYGHVVLDNGGNCVVQGNVFASPSTNGQLRDFIQIYASADHNLILGNQFTVNGTLFNSLIDDAAANTYYGLNPGYLTINGGVSTQTPGAVTSVTIAHGLARAPKSWSVQPNNSAAASAPAMYLTADATNLTLTFSSALTAATAYAWVWRAQV